MKRGEESFASAWTLQRYFCFLQVEGDLFGKRRRRQESAPTFVTARIMGVIFALLSGGLSSGLPPLCNTHESCRYTSRHATSGITAQPWPWAPLWTTVTALCLKTVRAHPLPVVFVQCTFLNQLQYLFLTTQCTKCSLY